MSDSEFNQAYESWREEEYERRMGEELDEATAYTDDEFDPYAEADALYDDEVEQRLINSVKEAQ